jgi:hypothetical protein
MKISVDKAESDSKRVALVCMPFSSIRRPSIALGLLKRVLRKKRIEADILQLNLWMAKRMDLEIYESISGRVLQGEYIFSQHLFGEFGSGELKSSIPELKKDRQNYRKMTRGYYRPAARPSGSRSRRLILHLEPPDRVARIVVEHFSPYHNGRVIFCTGPQDSGILGNRMVSLPLRSALLFL